MRILILSILLLFADLSFGANYPPSYYIPAGGQTLNSLTYFDIANQSFYVGTNGATNLSGNTYTLTYASLPPANTQWNVIFDATDLTVNTNTNVNIFGETPLATYSPTKKFYINFSVVFDAGVPTKRVTYFASLSDLRTFVGTTNFNGRVNFKDTVVLEGGKDYLKPTSAISTGNSVVAADTTGKLTYGCSPWCTTGNSGLNSALNFLGNTDTVALRFRVNNVASGIIDYNLFNTALGYTSFLANTTGAGNSSMGFQSLKANTTGNSNVSIGLNNMLLNTSGTGGTSVGYDALATVTTGNYNTAIGYNADVSSATTHDGVAIGTTSRAGNYGVALGSNAVASNNQFLVKNVRVFSLPTSSSSVNYVLTDTSGTGDFVPRQSYLTQQTYRTPITGDSSVISTSANLVDPAGTIANYTIILPASPYSGQILEFSFTQIVSTLHWSVALNQAVTAAATLPSATTAGQAFSIQYNSDTQTWYNY